LKFKTEASPKNNAGFERVSVEVKFSAALAETKTLARKTLDREQPAGEEANCFTKISRNLQQNIAFQLELY